MRGARYKYRMRGIFYIVSAAAAPPRAGAPAKNIVYSMLKWSCGEPQSKSLRGQPPQILEQDDNVCLHTNTKEKCVEVLRAKDKEELYQKINSREPIGQIGMNPFHANKYVDDIDNQEKFLRRP